MRKLIGTLNVSAPRKFCHDHQQVCFHAFSPLRSDGDGEINEEEFLRIMKKTSLY